MNWGLRQQDPMRPVNTLVFLLILLFSILLAGVVWMAGDIFALFVVAFILAYLFDPLATFLTRHKFSRAIAALVIMSAFVIIVCGALAILGPIIYGQIDEIMRGLQAMLKTMTSDIAHALTPYSPALRQMGLSSLIKPTDQPLSSVGPVAATVLRGGMAFASTMGMILLVPIVAFYLLKDWPRMLSHVLAMLPARKRPVVREIGREIDRILSAFLHGQAQVCLCVAILYVGGFMAIGLNYGLVIGLVSGALKFLPYIGVAVAFALTVSTAVVQSGWDGWLIAAISGVFLLVEIIDVAFLSPRLIGTRVQLAPALVILAILLGAKLFGVIGVFIAIPVFAVGRVLLTFWLRNQSKVEPIPLRTTARAVRRT